MAAHHRLRPPGQDGAFGLLASVFARFRQRHFEAEHDLYDQLIDGQGPDVMVITCSDSRTDPAINCGAEPGDLFVIRDVTALVAPSAKGGPLYGMAPPRADITAGRAAGRGLDVAPARGFR